MNCKELGLYIFYHLTLLFIPSKMALCKRQTLTPLSPSVCVCRRVCERACASVKALLIENGC